MTLNTLKFTGYLPRMKNDVEPNVGSPAVDEPTVQWSPEGDTWPRHPGLFRPHRLGCLSIIL